jgi:hypothetical protein
MTDRPACSKCASDDVLVYMTPETAICPACCDDHEYVSEGCERYCEHCGQEPPDDWHDGQYDDDVPLFGAATLERIGVPASSMNGNAAQKGADPERWANWLAFCERNGMP